MQRQTARLLLVLLLVGIFAPVALAISAPATHACCLRKPLHDDGYHGARIQAPNCCDHNCCRPLIVTQWAHASSFRQAYETVAQPLRTDANNASASDLFFSYSFSRAPPQYIA